MQTIKLVPALGIATALLLVGAACSYGTKTDTNVSDTTNVDTTNADVNATLEINADLNVSENENANVDAMKKEENNTNAETTNTSATTNTTTNTAKNTNTAATNTTANVNAVTTKAIAIDNLAFASPSVTVKKGTKVTWTNNDSVAHTVTSTTGSELSSGTVAAGKTFSHTFDTAGTFAYTCTFHPSMTGTVIVTE